jgi:hypothetical protein
MLDRKYVVDYLRDPDASHEMFHSVRGSEYR